MLIASKNPLFHWCEIASKCPMSALDMTRLATDMGNCLLTDARVIQPRAGAENGEAVSHIRKYAARKPKYQIKSMHPDPKREYHGARFGWPCC